MDAVEFVPGRSSSKVSVKDARDGTEIDLADWKRNALGPRPVRSFHQCSTQTQSSPPRPPQEGQDQTVLSSQPETRHRSTLFVPPGLRRQDLGLHAEPELWDPSISAMIEDEASTSLSNLHDPHCPSWPPCASVSPHIMNLPQHPSYDHGYTSGAPYSDQDASSSNCDTASQILTLLTLTPSPPVFTPKYAYLRQPVTPSIGGPPSPPTTPSTRNTSLTSSASRLNTDAPTFIPGRRPTKVSIQDPIHGVELKIEDRRRGGPPPLPTHTPFAYPVRRQPIRLESESAKRKRVAEERQRKAKEAVGTAKQAEQPKEGKTDLKGVEEGIIPEEQAVLREHKDDEVKERSPRKQEDPVRDTGNGGEGEQTEASAMSEADARMKIDQDVKALFDRRNLDEAEAYFSHLPSTYHEYLVDQLVLKAIKSNEVDATLVANFFARAASNNLCSLASFEAGFVGVAEFLEVIAINTPKAWDLMAILINGAALNNAGQRRIASKTTDADRLLRNLCVATLGGSEGCVQPLDSSTSHLYSSSDTSGSALPKSSICIEPQHKVDEAVDALQHARPHNISSIVLSDMQQLYASQIEEYRSREATWVEEVKFLRQQVVVWQELYRQSEKERENLIRQQRMVDEARDRSPPSDS